MSNTCKNITQLTHISWFKTFCLSKAVAICENHLLYKNSFILQKPPKYIDKPWKSIENR